MLSLRRSDPDPPISLTNKKSNHFILNLFARRNWNIRCCTLQDWLFSFFLLSQNLWTFQISKRCAMQYLSNYWFKFKLGMYTVKNFFPNYNILNFRKKRLIEQYTVLEFITGYLSWNLLSFNHGLLQAKRASQYVWLQLVIYLRNSK